MSIITVNEAKTLTKKYTDWIFSNTEFQQSDEWIEITTSYLDNHNDAIQIYLKKFDDQYVLCDDGFVKSELFLSGLHFNTTKQKTLFDSVMKSFGIYEEGDVLYKSCSEKEFPFQLNVFIQGVQSLLDLFHITKPQTKSFFYEEILSWFNENDIFYSKQIKVSGKSGFDHSIDFLFPKSRNKKERLVKILTKANKLGVESAIFAFGDIKEIRNEFEPIVLINDKDDDVSKGKKAFEEYNILPVPWSEKERYTDALSTRN